MSAAPSQPHEVVRTEHLAPEPAEALAAMLDIELPCAGTLPPLWHWIYLLERRPQRDLGADGHPTSGIPAPPGPGRRRMFAGGRVTSVRPLAVGEPATRTTRVASSVEKQGRSGPLTFVTVRNEFTQHGQVAVVDEQDIVYRAPGSSLATPDATEPVKPREPHLTLDVDSALLFRFSALTYNAHRIHYDRDFVQEEGYADLVVHGPLQALMMGELFRRNDVSLVGRRYAYRLVSPMVGCQRMSVGAGASGIGYAAETLSEQGLVTAVGALEDAS